MCSAIGTSLAVWLFAHIALMILPLTFLAPDLVAQTPVQSPLFGMNVQTPYTSFWPNQPIGALGKQMGTTWKWLETCDGGPDPSNVCYNWSGLDAGIAQAQAKGLSVVYSFGGVPSWAGPAANMAPSNWTYLSDFATAIATRYKGKIKYYEEFNEPDSNGQWNDTYANLVQYAMTVYQAVKAVDPNALVGAPSAAVQVYQPSSSPTTGASDFVNWMERYFQAGGNQYADFAGWHAYACQPGKYACNTTIGCDMASGDAIDCASDVIYNQYDQYSEMLSSVGLGNVPLLVTEAGWAKDDGDGFCPNYNTTACMASLLLEPAYVSRFYIFMASAGANGTRGVQGAYWYFWGSSGGFDNGGWGTLNGSDGQNPAAGVAYGQTYNWLVGSTFSGRCSASGTVWSCPLTLSSGVPALIVWDSSLSCNASSCSTSTYTVAGAYTNYYDLTGASYGISNGTIQISPVPLLLTAPVSFNPLSLSFGNQSVGAPSATQSITLTNPSSAALSITQIAITGANAADFSQTNTCGTSVAGGGSCTIAVTFTPQAVGARTAAVSVADNLVGSPQTAGLTGTGIGVAQIALSPSSLSFGNQNVGSASAAQSITVTNPGSATLSITQIAITGANPTDFSQTNTCGTGVVAGGSCTIAVSFTPHAVGARSAAVSVADNAAGSPQTVGLSGMGIGVAQVSLSPSSLSFGNQRIKTTSGAHAITLTNPGSAALSITKIAITGSNAADFSQTNTCGSSVAPGGSCTISVRFTPRAFGARSAAVSVTDNAAGSPQKVALSGYGTR